MKYICKIEEFDGDTDQINFVFASGKTVQVWFSASDGVEELFVCIPGQDIEVSIEPSGENVLPEGNDSLYLR